jgi:hypothetical protein
MTMNPHNNDSSHQPEVDDVFSFEIMYERMLERLYLTSATRFIPRYTLETARLRSYLLLEDMKDTEAAA